MAFADDETGITSSRPIDLYTITIPTATYRLTSAGRDVSYGGHTYTAGVVSRGQIEVAPYTDGRELRLYLPASHTLARRYMQLGIPPQSVHVLMRRLQSVSGVAIQQAEGQASSITAGGRMACLHVLPLTDEAEKVRLPVFAAQRRCNHVLYGPDCQLPRDGSTGFSTTIVSVSGLTLTIASIAGHPDNWARYGEIIHAPTGEKRGISTQVGTMIVINAPLPDAASGHGVDVFRGCAHTIDVCLELDNVVNFGGAPRNVKAINFWAIKGLGIRSGS